MTVDVHCPKGGRHEFGSSYSLAYDEAIFAMCEKCDEVVMEADDILDKLNAAMQLTGESAEIIADGMSLLFDEGTQGHIRLGDLRNYARRWRGDTEESE